MSTVVPLRTAAYRAPRLALLGTGVVGSALVAAMEDSTDEADAASRAGGFLRPLRTALDGLAVTA